jgi:hypothetical protein
MRKVPSTTSWRGKFLKELANEVEQIESYGWLGEYSDGPHTFMFEGLGFSYMSIDNTLFSFWFHGIRDEMAPTIPIGQIFISSEIITPLKRYLGEPFQRISISINNNMDQSIHVYEVSSEGISLKFIPLQAGQTMNDQFMLILLPVEEGD